MNKHILTTIGLVGTASSFVFAKQPDIILIMTDQQTASAMSCVGNTNVQTPAMDELAKDGVLFNRAYVSFPLSGPSRASLFTGKTPSELGVEGNEKGIRKEDMQQNLGFQLLNAGYNCLYAGKWHVHETNIPTEGTGFRKVCNMNDPVLVEQCIPYLKEKSEKPMFLVASFLNPHEICEYARRESLPYGNLREPHIDDCPNLPYNYPEPAYYPEALLLHKEATPKVYPTRRYTDDDWRKYLYAYYRLVERVDKEVGKLITELKKNGKYDNSLIIFVSDHGDGVAAHHWNQKSSLQDEVLRVPFIVKAPKGQGLLNVKKEKALVNINLDIFQTICDYAGVKTDSKLNGKSVRPLVETNADKLHERVFAETRMDDLRGWCVIEEDYKYVLYRYHENREQLFDLKKDPWEMQNLAKDRSKEELLNKYRKTLYGWNKVIKEKMFEKQLKQYDN